MADKTADDESVLTNRSSPTKEPRLSAAEVAALSDGHTHCLVCYSDLDYRGKTPCDHDDICGVCHLRLRFLHDDKKCPICKAVNDSIIVDKDPSKSNRDYTRWGDEIGAGFIHREDVGMFFQTDYYEKEILPLFACACQQCEFDNDGPLKKKQTSIQALQEHLRSQHRLALCQLCVDHKRDFVARLPRMNHKQLQNHLKKGDGPESGFFGHPVCQFCHPKRFYDLAYLHQHLHKEHYKCHVCEKQGLDNQFFKNYKSLEKHFDQQHFMCHDVQCLSARFVVFENELDLRAHEMNVHGGTSTGSTKINLEFRTRRRGYDGSGLEEQQEVPTESDFNYGLDGQAFVPQALPNQNNSSVQLHPLHLQRTEELRAQAAAIREQQALDTQAEAFPTLQSSMAPSAAPLVGWASGETKQRLANHRKEAGRVTEEDYPSLPTSNANKKKNAIKGNIGTASRQFATMNIAANASHPSYGNAAGTAAANAPYTQTNYVAVAPSPAIAAASMNRQADLTPDNFPSLGAPSTSRAQYSAANALGRKNMQKQQWSSANAPAINSAVDFPSISRSPAAAAPKHAPQMAQKAPPISSTEHFPPPPTSNSNPYNIRNNILGNNTKQHQATSNVLQANFASAASAKTSIEEMKASLGPNRFKQLKQLTKTFSDNQLSSEGYVDQSAALFDKGYGDPDFWSFLPALLESTPNQEASERALIYMTSIKRQQFETKPKPTPNASPPMSSWGSGAGSTQIRQAPPQAAKSAAVAQAYIPSLSALARPNVVTSNKKNAWGAGGATTVVRAKAPPGSVGVAAATQGPQGGTATKFMAKQQKKQNNNNNQSQNQNKGKNKKKERDELRSLAFGGK